MKILLRTTDTIGKALDTIASRRGFPSRNALILHILSDFVAHEAIASGYLIEAMNDKERTAFKHSIKAAIRRELAADLRAVRSQP